MIIKRQKIREKISLFNAKKENYKTNIRDKIDLD